MIKARDDRDRVTPAELTLADDAQVRARPASLACANRRTIPGSLKATASL
jgi:hypothetical protein